VVFGIISENRFQEYVNVIVSMAIGDNHFRWVNAMQPWRLEALVKPRTMFHQGLNGYENMAKGIFLLPHEITEKTWEAYRNMQAFHRTFGGNCLFHKSIIKLKPKMWLNDELINSYLALLPQNAAQGIKIANSFLFQTLQGDQLQNPKGKH
jgi:hypothetical protein